MRRGGWSATLLHSWEEIRESYWFFPAQLAVLSGALALGMVEIDRRLPPGWAASLPWITQGSAEGARAVLSTIAGSMITVTGVVFSMTVVALTLTSSQFGPRLLRTFFRDRGSQVALGTFLATFCYSLLVLRAVESPDRVPHLATAGGVLLAIASLFVLIFYVHHAASSIQASSVIAAVAREIREQIPSLFPETLGEERESEPGGADAERLARLEREGFEVAAEAEGYVRVLDDSALLELAGQRDLLVRLEARPGDFVTHGQVVARVLGAGEPDRELAECLRGAFLLGDHRTPVQDLRFLTDQLAEMAVRALSTGVNDPKTAVECVHRLGGALAQLAGRRMPSGLRHDEDGALRVVAEPTRFEAILGSCFDAIRRHGGADAQVAEALLEAVAAAARAGSDRDRLRALAEQAEEVHTAFATAGAADSKRDRARVEAAMEVARHALEDGRLRAREAAARDLA
jgi:uncharacterized membrane protein